jgi:hypothetical protein
MILSQSGQPIKFDNCDQWNVCKCLQTRTVITILGMVSFTFTTRACGQNLSPMMAILAYDVKGVFVRCPICLGQTMNALYYKSFMQCQLHSAVRKKCLEQVVNAIIQSENAIALPALWRMFSGFGCGKLCNTLPIVQTSGHEYNLIVKVSRCVVNDLQRGKPFLQQFVVRWHSLVHQVMLMVFTSFPVVSNNF